MPFKQAGYQAALVDMGLIKEAGLASGAKTVASKVKGFFSRKAPVPMGGQHYRPPIEGVADNAGANIFRSEMNAANPIQGLKNTPLPPPPAAAAATPPPGLGFTPASASAPEAVGATGAAGAPGTAATKKPGLLTRIRNNPVKSVALAGAGMGGVGYVMGSGAPPPGQPMQQYDPQMQMQAGYQ
jgi:hypothetical protein